MGDWGKARAVLLAATVFILVCVLCALAIPRPEWVSFPPSVFVPPRTYRSLRQPSPRWPLERSFGSCTPLQEVVRSREHFRRRSYQLSRPLWVLGSENSGQNNEEPLQMEGTLL